MNPIFRIGCLVSAVRSDGSVKAFSYQDSDKAVAALTRSSKTFDASIRDAMKSTLKKIDPAGRLDVPLPFDMTPKVAVRSHSLGVVFDFSEFTFLLRKKKILARGCVTVCVGPQNPPDEGSVEAPESHSKFWARFMIVEPDAEQSVKELRQFEKDCTALGEALLRAMEEPYRDLVRKLAGDPKLNVECIKNRRYRILAIDAPNDDFDELFEAIRDGERLGDQITTNSSAKLLAELGLAVIAGKDSRDLKKKYATDIRQRGVEVSFYDPADYYQGVMLKKREDDAEDASLVVGITQGPTFDESVKPAQRLRLAASNVVSVRLISNWGMRR